MVETEDMEEIIMVKMEMTIRILAIKKVELVVVN